MYAVKNMGQLLGQKAVTYGCPVDLTPKPGDHSAYAVTYDPTLNCMRDARGNTVCSDGSHYPPGCPHTPPDQYFTPGVTPDITNAQGMIEGQIPAPKGSSLLSETPGSSGGNSALLVGAGAAGAALLAAAGYYFFLRKG
jgi:hypothetical protein